MRLKTGVCKHALSGGCVWPSGLPVTAPICRLGQAAATLLLYPSVRKGPDRVCGMRRLGPFRTEALTMVREQQHPPEA
jgi:hypothetical protein